MTFPGTILLAVGPPGDKIVLCRAEAGDRPSFLLARAGALGVHGKWLELDRGQAKQIATEILAELQRSAA